MDWHNYIIGGWYLFAVLDYFRLVNKGYLRLTWGSLAFSALMYAGMAASIFAFGDPGSWQAIVFFIWWPFSIILASSKINERMEIEGGFEVGFTTFLYILLLVLGLNIPTA